MGYLSNTNWVNYVTRSYNQIMDFALVQLGYKVPEITDRNPTNPFIRDLSFVSAIAEQMGYYIDNVGRESKLDGMRIYSSAVSKAKEFDYKITGNLPYQVDVQFKANQISATDIVIPIGTILSNTPNEITYRITAVATILAGDLNSNIVNAIQSTLVTNVTMGTSLGIDDMEVVFNDKVVNDSVSLTWDGDVWNAVETLARSGPTSKHFVQTVNEDGNVIVYFGNAGPAGKVPPIGAVMVANYATTLGAAGGVGIGELNNIVSSLTLPVGVTLTVNNIIEATGGGDVETLEELKRHIPIARRTLKRAVTEADFADIMQLAPGVSSAGVDYDCGKNIDIYIIPVGGGVASTGLIASAQTFINRRKMITTNPVISSAGEVHVKIEATINVLENYYKTQVRDNVIAALTEMNSYANQVVGGSQYQSDIYQAIEGAAGVKNSLITKLIIEPYARPLSPSTPPLVWTKLVLAGSTQKVTWQIAFTSSTTFKLIRGATLIGTFSTGASVDLPEISFTIVPYPFSTGNRYKFVTYPYNFQSVELIEPSLPVTTAADIILTLNGGL